MPSLESRAMVVYSEKSLFDTVILRSVEYGVEYIRSATTGLSSSSTKALKKKLGSQIGDVDLRSSEFEDISFSQVSPSITATPSLYTVSVALPGTPPSFRSQERFTSTIACISASVRKESRTAKVWPFDKSRYRESPERVKEVTWMSFSSIVSQ